MGAVVLLGRGQRPRRFVLESKPGCMHAKIETRASVEYDDISAPISDEFTLNLLRLYFRPILLSLLVVCGSGCNLFESVESTGSMQGDLGLPDMLATDMMDEVEDQGDMGAADDGTHASDAAVDMDVPASWSQVEAGYAHSCALRDDGQVYCWGRGRHGRTGLGTEADVARPEPVLSDARFEALATGGSHTCALDSEGGLWCWGRGVYIGLPEVENALIPTLVDDGPFIELAAGNEHTCVITEANEVRCTGNNDFQEIGIANADDAPRLVTVPDVAATKIAAGGGFTCILDQAGQASCWGRSLAERFGADDPATSAVPALQGGPEFSELSAGQESVCGIARDSAVYCWGSSLYDRETRSDFERPGQISSEFEFVDVSTGKDFACAVATNSLVFCWGSNYRARMGIGGHSSDPSTVREVTLVNTTEEFASVSAGALHACGLTSAGHLRCWGREHHGATGRGELGYRTSPVPILSELKFVEISAGEYHSCGITSEGRVSCWGRDSYQAIGIQGSDEQPVPVVLADFDDASVIESVNSRNCVIDSSGAAFCWGDDSYGTLGNGRDVGDTETPGPVLGGLSFAAISMSRYATCGVTTDSQGACWGREGYLGADVGQVSEPTILELHPEYVDVAVGTTHGCGLDLTGKVHCWGDGSQGQLGQGSRSDSAFVPLPVNRNLPGPVVQIETLNSGSCALNNDGGLFCWGDRDVDGVSGSDSLLPAPVRPDLTFEWVDASKSHVCAIASGDIYCWGQGGRGQLGHGLLRDEDEPVQVRGLPDAATRVSVGDEHTCAIVGDGDVYCWGFGEFGMLGHGELGFLDSPTPLDESAVE